MAETLKIEQVRQGEAPQAVSIADRRTDELVFAFVGPVASGVTTTAELLHSILRDQYGYHVEYYKLSRIIADCASKIGQTFDDELQGHERTNRLQDIGNELRRSFSSEYLIEKCIEQIALRRVENGYEQVGDTAVPVAIRHAHIIDSVKHPEEVQLLKDVYGDIFWLIAVFAPEQVREKRLSRMGFDRSAAGPLIIRDEHEDIKYGQKVRDTSHLADFFVRNDKDNNQTLKQTISRYCDIIFNTSIVTPSKNESAMYNAMAAASRSACLSRQVGAAIYSRDGELIGIGWNDVPKNGGGLYSTEDNDNDHRCYMWGGRICHNDDRKEQLYSKIASILCGNPTGLRLVKDGVTEDQIRALLAGTDIRSLIEYSRAVHAEMEAIISVARSGKKGLKGAALYSTTFPCHSCARHIVASGISRVVYIEPYPKSLALDLHDDAISIDEKDDSERVVFLQYEGVAPRNMLRLFKHNIGRKKNGKLIARDKKTALPVFPQPLDSYARREQIIVKQLVEKEKVNIKAVSA